MPGYNEKKNKIDSTQATKQTKAQQLPPFPQQSDYSTKQNNETMNWTEHRQNPTANRHRVT